MITDLAQAVADALNAGTFSMEFTAERVALPDFELADMKDLHVTVVPREVESALLDRARDSHDVKVDVAVQKKLASMTNEEIDPLMVLVQEILGHMNRRNLGDAVWRRTENKPVYSPEHLREMRQFTSVLTLTYRIAR